MRPIDGDALAERIMDLQKQIAGPAAGFVDEDSYECGALDALTDALNYIQEAPDLGEENEISRVTDI